MRNNIQQLHKMKAEQSYYGAKESIEEGLEYPSYMLLKEAVRATLAYINEDLHGNKYSAKTRLSLLISQAPLQLTGSVKATDFNYLLELEEEGLSSILYADLEKLDEIRRSLKKVMAAYLNLIL